jgi:hypothetical protein
MSVLCPLLITTKYIDTINAVLHKDLGILLKVIVFIIVVIIIIITTTTTTIIVVVA